MERKQSISEFLLQHTAKNPVSFHMPGHKGRRLFAECGLGDRVDCLIDGDVTEIHGADNLFQAESSLRAVMDRYKAIYGSRESFLSINGSSGALIAAILTCVPPGQKLAMARNCHKSVTNGVRLGGVRPVYIYPELLEGFGISGAVTPEAVEKTLTAEPECRAVLITSPSYYGITSDIPAIAEVCHKHGCALIVDQAHGAHLDMFRRELGGDWANLSADGRGADIVVESTHKTMATFTQTALANIYGPDISIDAYADKMQMIESTSPSYILMASLDMNAEILENHGKRLAQRWQENLDYFYAEAAKIPGLKVLAHPMHDRTKLVFDTGAWGVPGDQIADRLREDDYVFLELESGNIAMAMTGIGNVRADYERLIRGLWKIGEEEGFGKKKAEREAAQAADKAEAAEESITMTKYMYLVREQCDIPRESVRIHYTEAEGRVAATAIIPYPPGAPMITPGEVLDLPSLDYAMKMRARGAKVIGMDADGYIFVGK